MLSFWPGFQGIARYGQWSFLVIALAFALLLDAFLILNFYWTAILTTTQRNGFLLILVAAWVFLSIVAGVRKKALDVQMQPDEKDKTFSEAIAHYLRGNWLETETLIANLLKKNPRDSETLLLQATLFRHTNRFVEATATLNRLRQFEGSERWLFEIEMEGRLLNEKMSRGAEE